MRASDVLTLFLHTVKGTEKQREQDTCRPMTHCPALIFSSSNIRSCFSAYFTPMSTCDWQPLVLAWQRREGQSRSNQVVLRKVNTGVTSVDFGWIRLTMLARASSVVWTCVMLPFSNRSLASKMS